MRGSSLKVYVYAVLLIVVATALLMSAIGNIPKPPAGRADLYCPVPPDLEAYGGGVLKVKIAGSGFDKA